MAASDPARPKRVMYEFHCFSQARKSDPQSTSRSSLGRSPARKRCRPCCEGHERVMGGGGNTENAGFQIG